MSEKERLDQESAGGLYLEKKSLLVAVKRGKPLCAASFIAVGVPRNLFFRNKKEIMSLASGVKLRRGFENTGLKANRFNSAQFSEPILTQGEINADCIVDARLGKLREQAVKDLPRDEVFGSDLGQNMQFVDIGMQEPLLIHRKPITSNGFEKYFPKKAHVFSSLNGM